MNNYLSQEEIDRIISFNQNPKTVEAVKKVLLHTIYNQGTVKPGKAPEPTNWVFGVLNGQEASDYEIASKIQASLKGLSYLESGFQRLAEFKKDEKKKEKVNPAV